MYICVNLCVCLFKLGTAHVCESVFMDLIVSVCVCVCAELFINTPHGTSASPESDQNIELREKIKSHHLLSAYVSSYRCHLCCKCDERHSQI